MRLSSADESHYTKARQLVREYLHAWLSQLQSRSLRTALLVLIYSGAIVCARGLAYQIRFEFHVSSEQWVGFWRTLGWSLPAKLLLLYFFGQFRSLLTYFSFPDVARIVMACGVASAMSLVIWYASHGSHAPPRSIILLNFFLSAASLIAVRVTFRLWRQHARTPAVRKSRKVAILGAGDVGANLAKELQQRRDLCLKPVAFFDDDLHKWNRRIHGIPVLGPVSMLENTSVEADEVILAMPNAPARRLREIIHVLNSQKIPCQTVPSLEQIIAGAVKVSQIRPVEIEDLLGRERVPMDTDHVCELLEGKVVLVTGAGGTIGGELCRQIAAHRPGQLILLERSESLLFPLEQDLRVLGFGSFIVPIVADILDLTRMQGVFERYRPALVFHAAAHKHVPMMEHQPAEAFRNNTIGSRCVMDLAIQHRVERCVMISTDKAINPTNVMGATKRLAEVYMQAVQASDPRTKFIAVRFGNVLGSSGSVIPTFKKQIAAGGPVTVTHPDVTRYFMSVSEAVGLVLQSATLGEGGEIFVLDMGRPIKIVDLARQLIELSGLEPDRDIEIKFTGLRPGEKLFEEITHNSENIVPTGHSKIMRFVSSPQSLDTLSRELDRLEANLPHLEPRSAKLLLKSVVPEYTPYIPGESFRAHSDGDEAERESEIRVLSKSRPTTLAAGN